MRLIKRQELIDQNAYRPTVTGDMVKRKRKDVFVVTQLVERRAQRRLGLEIERLRSEGAQVTMHLAPTRPGRKCA
ncbi:hypothetical protein GCM10027514_28240 [Azotobacter armeniacus]